MCTVSVEGGCRSLFNISLLDQGKWVNQNAKDILLKLEVVSKFA